MRVMRLAAWLGITALSMALAGCAQAGSASKAGAEAHAATDGVLAGVVVDDAVRPLRGVNVTLQGPGGPGLATATDANGTFRFTGLADGSYTVQASLARHLTAYQVATVRSDGKAAPLLQMVLAIQKDELPFANAIVWDGFVGCAFSYGNLCSAPAQAGYDVVGDQSAHLFFHELVDVARVPDLIQGEAVWQATLPTSVELFPIYGWSEPETWTKELAYLGTFHGVSQPSPSFDRLAHDELLNASLGTDNGLVVEFYGGRPDGTPTGLTMNQPLRLVLHAFYGYLPPEEWRFVTDGAPPPPR